MLSKFVGVNPIHVDSQMAVIYCNDTSISFSIPTVVENAAYGRVNESHHHITLGPLTPPTNDQQNVIYETVQ